ncbi:hypothetical protein [Algibacter sp. 2305UL17-15]|uniref:hypothetical protein n=1 Tax=Algibacter sp. 2305UL17-15 TaxID=3231268 RepID=UPI003458B821
MKTFKTFFYTLIVFTALTFSCSSDSDSGGGGDEDLANHQNKTEENAVETSALSSGIEIAGATKNDGTPPQPNSNIDLVVASNKAEAHQKSGFNLKFSTAESNIAGAYLLFKDVNGNGASNYFDVPVSSFTTASKKANIKNNKSSKNKLFSKGNGLTDNEYEIDIDFGDAIPAGQFCSDLCLYDSENNVSQIVTVCIEVEAWGGNASIVGTWKVVETTGDDDNTQISCTNGQTVEVPYEEVIYEEYILNFENNGDFYYTDKSEYNYLDYQASAESCSGVYSDVESEENDEKYTGKWAYNEDELLLTLITFKYEDFLNPQYNEDFTNGEILFDGSSGKVEVVGNKLIFTQTYVGDGESNTYVTTLERI